MRSESPSTHHSSLTSVLILWFLNYPVIQFLFSPYQTAALMFTTSQQLKTSWLQWPSKCVIHCPTGLGHDRLTGGRASLSFSMHPNSNHTEWLFTCPYFTCPWWEGMSSYFSLEDVLRWLVWVQWLLHHRQASALAFLPFICHVSCGLHGGRDWNCLQEAEDETLGWAWVWIGLLCLIAFVSAKQAPCGHLFTELESNKTACDRFYLKSFPCVCVCVCVGECMLLCVNVY